MKVRAWGLCFIAERMAATTVGRSAPPWKQKLRAGVMSRSGREEGVDRVERVAHQRAHRVGGVGVPVAMVDALRVHIRIVDARDEEGRVIQHEELAGRVAPEKARVLADVDVGEGIPAPERLRVAERVAGDPGPLTRRIDVLPGAVRRGLVVVDASEAADGGARVEQGRGLVAKPVRRGPVVIIPVDDELAARGLTGEVALGAYGVPPLQSHVADA